MRFLKSIIFVFAIAMLCICPLVPSIGQTLDSLSTETFVSAVTSDPVFLGFPLSTVLTAILAVFELLIRIMPTKSDWSILSVLYRVFSAIIPNKSYTESDNAYKIGRYSIYDTTKPIPDYTNKISLKNV